MMEITRMLTKQVPDWDRPTQIALGTALALSGVMIGVALFGGEALRVPAILAIGSLFLTIQGIALWGNRNLVTPFTKAQRLYLRGELNAAREVLEAQRATGAMDVQELTLLGNIHRQTGELATSETILQAALEAVPGHYFPLVGLGRTQIAQGDYPAAVGNLQEALEGGAPAVVRYDLAEAHFRAGDEAAAIATLPDDAEAEPHRALMAAWLGYRAGGGDVPSAELVEAGLPYWEAAAVRFEGTPYGQALAQDIREMQAVANGHAD